MINFVETAGEVCGFCCRLDPEGRAEVGEYHAEVTMAELEAGAAQRDSDVESVYCGAVGDNVAFNLKALTMVDAKYLKLILAGDAVHCPNLMCGGVAE